MPPKKLNNHPLNDKTLHETIPDRPHRCVMRKSYPSMRIIIETRLLRYVSEGYCSPLNILMGNYQKRKKCAVQDLCNSNSLGGH